MTTFEKWLLAIIIIVLIIVIYKWNQLKAWFTSVTSGVASAVLSNAYNDCLTNNKALAEGAPCVMCFDQSNLPPGIHLGSNVNGIIHNGVCIGQAEAQNNTPPASSNNLQVSNPAGAAMYYQSPGRFGGVIYSRSNVVLPVGTNLILLNTVPNNSIFGKYFYETNYKQYGPTSGFFNSDDFKKI